MPVDDRQVKQGYLESSNVKPMEEMIKIMEATRAYQSYMKLITGFGDIENKIITEMSRV